MKQIFTCFLLLFTSNWVLSQSSFKYNLHESIGITPTAFSLQKGENRLTNTDLVAINYTRGVTDNASFNVGFVANQTAFMRVKYTHELLDFLRVGVSPAVVIYDHSEYSPLHPMVTGTVTLGSSQTFLNLAYSKSLKKSDLRDSYSIGICLHEGKKTLYTEHIFEFPDSPTGNYYTVHSLIYRVGIKQNHSMQFGFFIWNNYYYSHQDKQRSNSNGLPLPIISYSYHWGKIKPVSLPNQAIR